MRRLFSLFFLSVFTLGCGAQQSLFQGRLDMSRDLASFEALPPEMGTLYLLTGAAENIRILGEEPFVAEVDFVQSEWKSESSLVAHRAVLRFEGAGWSGLVVVKKPRQGAEPLIYPHRKFQVAAVASPGFFKVLATPVLF